METEFHTGPPQMGLKDLPNVHAAWHAQRIKEDLNWRSVGQKRHIFFRKDFGDHTLIAVPAGHLVADRDHAAGCHVDLHHLKDSWTEFVATLHAVLPAITGIDGFVDRRPQRLIKFLNLRLPLRGADIEIIEFERGCPLGHCLVVLIPHERTAVGSGERLLKNLLNFSHERCKDLGDLSIPDVFRFLELLFKLATLLLGKAHSPREFLGRNDNAFHTRGHFEGVVLHIFAGPPEDGMQKFLFWGQFCLALRRNLADQDFARTDIGANSHNPALIEIVQGPLTDVGNVPRKLFTSQLCIADFDVIFLDMDRGVNVVLH